MKRPERFVKVASRGNTYAKSALAEVISRVFVLGTEIRPEAEPSPTIAIIAVPTPSRTVLAKLLEKLNVVLPAPTAGGPGGPGTPGGPGGGVGPPAVPDAPGAPGGPLWILQQERRHDEEQ